MENIDVELDESDDDIFVVKEVKPINKLTVQEALLIKHNVLQSIKSRKSKSKKKQCQENKSERSKSKNGKKSLNVQYSPSKNNLIAEKNSSSSRNLDFFIKTENNFTSCENSDSQPSHSKKDNSDTKEEIQLSPGIARRRKKFKITGNESLAKSPKGNSRSSRSPKYQSSPVKGFMRVPEFPSFEQSFNSSNQEQQLEINETNIKQESETRNLVLDEDGEQQNEYFDDNGELLTFLLKKIVSEVVKNQMALESKHTADGITIGKLFLVKDFDVLEEFCHLDKIYSKVYVRLLCRSRCWYRASTINFKDVDVDLNDIFEVLHQKKLIDTDIRGEELSAQMQLLSKNEIKKLCKAFMLSGKLSNTGKKRDLIDALISVSHSQKNVMNMFKKTNTESLTSKLQNEVIKCLGLCVRVNESVKATFNKVILLFSFPHFWDEEEKRFRSQLYMCMNLHKGFIKFPNYNLSPTVVFQTLEDLENYNEALVLKESFESAIICKAHDNFISLSKKASDKFKTLLKDNSYIQRYMNLQPFLRKFSAGHIYAKLLTKFCCKFKTKSNVKEIIGVAQMLLDQKTFLPSKRGKWYEILCQALESVKDNKAAGQLLIEAQKDSDVNQVQKLGLQLRGQTILKKKRNGIVDTGLKEILDDVCTISVQEPPSIEIRGKALQGNQSGYKTVYLEKTENGNMYTSVEERALLHYKTLGFIKGYHVEGYIVQTLYGLLFFDIIYGQSPPGVFQNSYQETPLDFYSNHFYENRKEAIDHRLHELSIWTEEEAERKIKSVYYENYKIQCLIIWKEHFTAELFCEIMKCMTLPVLANICKKFITNYGMAQSGFPDLTLWNPVTRKCKFVEVKSPNDKLSPGQRIWLDFLRNSGIDCEVCNVKNISRNLEL